MSRTRRPLRALALLAVAGVAVAPLVGTTPLATAAPAPVTSLDCPAGTVETTTTPGKRAFERENTDAAFRDLVGTLDEASGDRIARCTPIKSPEKFAELTAMQAERNLISAGPLGRTPAGALRAAVAGKSSATAAASTVPGAQGTFTPVGTTPLITDEPGYDSVTGSGGADISGRVDSFTYDPVNQRLFAAPGTGGVWMSKDLGESWVSVGDSLPFQSVGAVAWSPAGTAAHGTLVVASGEASAGGNVFTGMGAFYSTDSGKTWLQSAGVPDGLMGFEAEVDPTNPSVVYVATSQGLFRSADAGRTYRNVNLPTGRCAGKTGYDNDCMNGNWVTDVEVQEPGGTTDAAGGAVIAAVGYRAGLKPFPGTDLPQSPQNGLYRSDTGAVGSFAFLDGIYAAEDQLPVGFAPQQRVGRTELGAARGPAQDHGYLYALVQDAVLFNGGLPVIDAADPTTQTGALPNNTALNGVFVSPDFGASWMRMADELELQLPITESALIGGFASQLYQPGIQAWYNQFIEPDPTAANAAGVPTRLVFGLEEVWATRLDGTPQDGVTQSLEPASFKVIGPYNSGSSCAGFNLGVPVCPTSNTAAGQTTTHADQQAAIFVPAADGAVTMVIGNDGGVFTQTLAAGEAPDKTKWGRGANKDFHTLLPYDAEVAKDGTVWMGLQDNGTAKIEPGGKQIGTFGGDGFFVAVDPDDANIAYEEATLADMRATTDGGLTWRGMAPPVTAPLFGNPFSMDPLDPNHLIVGGPEVMETVAGPATGTGGWTEVFNTGEGTQVTATELQGDTGYVGFCSTCDIINKPDAVFTSGLATNAGPDAAAGSPDGWRIAAAKGLPERYITSVTVDPVQPRTIYVTLAGYANRQWWPAGAFNDKNPALGEGHVFKSTDAGESFTDISGSLPDVPARWVELNRGQLAVGTDVGVFLSNNTSGQRWAALKGLPNVPVTSINTHPAKPDELIVATFGRGVYRYTMSARAGSTTPVAGPVAQPSVRPAGGSLPATGLGATAAAVGVLALLGGLAVRRRTHA